MGDYGSTIPLNNSYKSSIIQAISDGIKKDVSDFKAENVLETYNGINFLKWDFINTNIIKTLKNNNKFQCLKYQRGPSWVLVLIYDKETNYLYCLMSKQQFNLLKDKERDHLHYIDALALINKGLKAKIKKYKQIKLFNIEDKTIKNADKKSLLSDILQRINGKVMKFAIITYLSEKREITSVSAYMLTTALEIGHEENWNELITVDYNNSPIIEDNINKDDEEEINMKLRVDPTQSNNNIIKLKRKKDKK
jgi:hypothetical protein